MFLSVLVTCGTPPAHAALTADELAEYKRIVSDPGFNKYRPVEERPPIGKILKAAVAEREYTILEAAMNNRNFGMMFIVITQFALTIPPEDRKGFLLRALANPDLWPSDERITEFERTAGREQLSRYLLQETYVDILAKTFGKEVPKYQGLWTSKQRAELSESLHAQFTVPPAEGKVGLPPPAPVVHVKPSEATSTQGDGGAQSHSASSQREGSEGTATPYLWIAFGSIFAAAAGWMFLRTKGKKG